MTEELKYLLDESTKFAADNVVYVIGLDIVNPAKYLTGLVIHRTNKQHPKLYSSQQGMGSKYLDPIHTLDYI